MTEEMYSALCRVDASVRKFLISYAEQLDEDRQAQLTDLTVDKGFRIGLHILAMGCAPTIEVTLTDSAGGRIVLEKIEFPTATSH